MNRFVTRTRAAWMGVVAAAIVGLVALAPHLGHTNTSAPLWSERPVPAAPAAAAAQPNWVELTRALKPAVVNISTKRVEERVQFQNPFGNQSPFGDDEQLQQCEARAPHTAQLLGCHVVPSALPSAARAALRG